MTKVPNISHVLLLPSLRPHALAGTGCFHFMPNFKIKEIFLKLLLASLAVVKHATITFLIVSVLFHYG